MLGVGQEGGHRHVEVAVPVEVGRSGAVDPGQAGEVVVGTQGKRPRFSSQRTPWYGLTVEVVERCRRWSSARRGRRPGRGPRASMPDEPQAGGRRKIVSARNPALAAAVEEGHHRLVLLGDEGDEVGPPVAVEVRRDRDVDGARARVERPGRRTGLASRPS